ncbi:MAG: FAD-dependent monooxygenase [Cellvibrionales bacterium]|nr:FAD-dependent monooxygenase [Cellvibrionales bacterium]
MNRPAKNCPLRVLIVGAGIGGLTAAINLVVRNIPVRVIERSASSEGIGAGLQLQPNATRVLHAMGLAERLAAVSMEPSENLLTAAYSGRVLARLPQARTRIGLPHYQLHRADLQHILLESAHEHGVQILPGQRAVGHTQDSAGVTLQTQDGGEYRAEVLIGADGARSAVRTWLFGAGEPADQPVLVGLAYRGLVDAEKVEGKIIPGAVIGPRRHFVSYPLRGGSLINFVAQEEIGGLSAEENKKEKNELQASAAELAALRARFAGWSPQVEAILRAADTCLRWPLYRHRPLPAWSVGRVGLLGDACHPSLPNLASGAGMAIEDGYIIAASLEKYAANPTHGLREFYRLRSNRCARIQTGAAWMATLFHLHPPLQRYLVHGMLAVASRIAPGLVAHGFTWTHHYDATKIV